MDCPLSNLLLFQTHSPEYLPHSSSGNNLVTNKVAPTWLNLEIFARVGLVSFLTDIKYEL